MQVTYESKDELIEQLMAVAERAVLAILKKHPAWRHECDDALGEAYLGVAWVIESLNAGHEYDNLKGYCYRVAWNNVWSYLHSICEWTRPYVSPPDRLPEADYIRRHTEVLEEVLASCSDAQDREIVRRRVDGQTMAEIGIALGVDKSTVSRRLKGIEATFDERNQ